jgi:hypothetical protein
VLLRVPHNNVSTARAAMETDREGAIQKRPFQSKPRMARFAFDNDYHFNPTPIGFNIRVDLYFKHNIILSKENITKTRISSRRVFPLQQEFKGTSLFWCSYPRQTAERMLVLEMIICRLLEKIYPKLT